MITRFLFNSANFKIQYLGVESPVLLCGAAEDQAAAAMEGQAAAVMRLLDMKSSEGARAIILYGFGGVGKTTLANYLMSTHLPLWTAHRRCTITIDDTSLDIKSLQEKILADLGGEKVNLRDDRQGREELSQVLRNQMFFLLIDNVNKKEHLQLLLPQKLSLQSQSRIIITSRENDVGRELDIECKECPVQTLPPEKAKELLRSKMEGFFNEGYWNTWIVAITELCDGVPLLLGLVGQHLRGHFSWRSNNDVWEKVLDSLQREGSVSKYNSQEDCVRAKLSHVYHCILDGNENAKEAFLDICAFFHGWQRNVVSSIVGWEELRTLEAEGLVSEVSDKVTVHDLVRELGIKLLEAKGTRVNTLRDLTEVLRAPDELPQTLKQKTNYNPRDSKGFDLEKATVVKFPGKPVLPTALKHLDLSGCKALQELPQDLSCLTALRSLVLNGCTNLIFLPEEICGLGSLRCLSMRECLNLTALPEDIGRLSSLISLDLWRCINLKRLPATFGSLSSISRLNLRDCEKLQKLPEGLENFLSLQELTLSGCKSLKRLRASFGRPVWIKSFVLEGLISLRELPESIWDSYSCNELILRSCNSLTSLPPNTFGFSSGIYKLEVSECSEFNFLPTKLAENLKSLQFITLCGCSSLKEVPEGFYDLVSLMELLLMDCTNLSSLPKRFGELTSITKLSLRGCERLSALPDDFGNLKVLRWLDLSKCKSLRRLPHGFGNLNHLQHLQMNSCDHLERLCRDFEFLKSLKELHISNCEMLEGSSMKSVVRLNSLCDVYIEESLKLEEQWELMQKEDEDYPLVHREPELYSRAAEVEIFHSKNFLFDRHGRSMLFSDLVHTGTTIAFFVGRSDCSPRNLQPGLLRKLVDKLTSDCWEVIYVPVDEDLKNLDCCEVPEFLPEGSHAIHLSAIRIRSLLTRALNPDMYCGKFGVVIVEIVVDEKGCKRLVEREKISAEFWIDTSEAYSQEIFVADAIKKFLKVVLDCQDIVPQFNRNTSEQMVQIRKPSNIRQFTQLLVRNGMDYFIQYDGTKVKWEDLKCPLDAFFICRLDSIELLKLHMYIELANKNSNFQAVWMPVEMGSGYHSISYGRPRAFVPWVTLHPSMKAISTGDYVILSDKIGSKEEMQLVLRWGADAYPFTKEKLEEWKQKELTDLHCQSSLEFLLGETKFLDCDGVEVKKEFLREKVVLLYGGRRLHNFAGAYKSLKNMGAENFEFIYVGREASGGGNTVNKKYEYDKSYVSEQTLGLKMEFSAMRTFWHRYRWLTNKWNSYLVDDENWPRLTRFLRHVDHYIKKGTDCWSVLFDGDGEAVTGKGEELANILVLEPRDEDEEMVWMEVIESMIAGRCSEVMKKKFRDDQLS
eukprot:Gb_26719 [translate_table: standard]